MSNFTQDNTEGFTDAELKIINNALEVLLGDFDEDNPTSVCVDALNNAWAETNNLNTVELLVLRARSNLGIK